MTEIHEELVVTVAGQWVAFHLEDPNDVAALYDTQVGPLAHQFTDPSAAAPGLQELASVAIDAGANRLAVRIDDGLPSSFSIVQHREQLPALIVEAGPEEAPTEIGYVYWQQTGEHPATAERVTILGGSSVGLARRATSQEGSASSVFWALTPTGREVVRVTFTDTATTSDELHSMALTALAEAEWRVDSDDEPEDIPEPESEPELESDTQAAADSSPTRGGRSLTPPREIREGAQHG